MRASTLLQNIRVVLVNTSHPGNIGGVARAMKNMGLSRLVLVDPRQFPSEEAVARASGATDIFDSAQVVSCLEDALVGCSLAFGTSARERRIPWPLIDPRECGVAAVQKSVEGGEVALVFGREHAGLTNEELQRCHFHVHIPSDPAFSSLNLAAAVQVLTYEVRMAALALENAPVAPRQEVVVEEGDLPVTADEMESFYGHLEKSLVEIGFLDPASPRHLMSRLRRLYGRAEVTRLEMNILRGILTETLKAARGEHHKRGKTDV
ncbi:tRNA/rRNA methyltransferase/tRNA (cytidine32/uridine32-2'-O)-methyltransferase [Pseudomonas sp. AG1028]|uniref:tRNA (cytosine(32)/uridine(32)-2'-O)-methyltransferase TrmJ n=1 Tax=Pseudomonas sp. AG1028 TaxID=2572911 RepID=UPI0011ADCB6E|nr:tRNA (cytosine(32)/uridine(32)-2'-O)-methyltransferase TrmJ [Pseudomonas sp. AG1028]TWE11055.1 tRNA/rRNA methyltransferase/tRNA (cytidine32/uridine32-2'-O)-methyltransferase [Pseudomonas sp. AG1028]